MLLGVQQGTFTLQLDVCKGCNAGSDSLGNFQYIESPRIDGVTVPRETRVMIEGTIAEIAESVGFSPSIIPVDCPNPDNQLCAICPLDGEFFLVFGTYKSKNPHVLRNLPEEENTGSAIVCFRDNGEGINAMMPDEATLILDGGPHDGYSVIGGEVRGNIQSRECTLDEDDEDEDDIFSDDR